MKRLIVLVAFLITACGNAPAVTPGAPQPTYGPIANGILADAGATNAAATGVAYIATGQVANAIAAQATAEYRATADNLSLQQTQSVMNAQATAIEGTAQANVAQATQGAAATATARANQQAIISITIAYVGTQLAYDSSVADAQAQADIMQARSDTARNQSTNDTISTAAIVIAVFVGLGVLVIVSAGVYFAILFMQDKREIGREAYQEKKASEIDEARARAAEAWARVLRESIIERNGKEYMLTRRGIVPMLPAPEQFSGTPDEKLEAEWRALAEAYVQSATELGRTGKEQYPFSEPSCVRNDLILHADTRRLWREGHRRLIGWLVKAGILAKTGDGGKTDWAGGWSLDRFEREFSHTPLPEVPYGAVPVAKILGRGWEVGEVRELTESL